MKKEKTSEVTRELRREQRARDLETIRSLHGFRKLQHILIYYRIELSIVFGSIFVVIALIYSVHQGSIPADLYFSLFTGSTQDYTQWADFLLAQMEDAGELNVEWVQSTYFTEGSVLSGNDESYLSTRIGVHELDLIISTEELYEYMLELEVLLPLTEILTEEEMQAWSDAVACSQDGTAWGLLLTEEQFPEAAEEDYYVYFCSTGENTENAHQLLQILMNASS
ncbi:MAG: hypothetical protein LUG62_07230 [Clostridiales bacterium]|nr:hypothetical protein [Clostridiales bacterium]